MKVSIVIPNYNGEELLERNLPKVIDSVSEYKDKEVEIIMVDDCSTDDSIRVIKTIADKLIDWKNKIRVFKNEENLGFSSTVNKGVSESKGEVVVLLNTDVIPEKNFLNPFLIHFVDPKVFGVGCMEKSVENGNVVLRGRGVGRWEKGFLVHSRGETDKLNTLWVSGGSGAFRKSIWDKLGGFSSLYNPFYWEDIDLSYRAVKSGYKILFEPKSIVVHEHEKGVIKKKFSSFQVKTVAYRNQFIFVWKNATDISLQFLHVLWLPYHFLKALIRLDTPFFIGFLRAFILLPKIIISSFKAQKMFVKTDYEIVKEFE